MGIRLRKFFMEQQNPQEIREWRVVPTFHLLFCFEVGKKIFYADVSRVFASFRTGAKLRTVQNMLVQVQPRY